MFFKNVHSCSIIVYLCLFYNLLQPVHPSDYAGPGFEYIVKYRVRNSGDEFTNVPVGPDKTSLEVRDEVDFQMYEVQVISQNQVGKSDTEPKTVIGISGESGMFSIFIFKMYKHCQYYNQTQRKFITERKLKIVAIHPWRKLKVHLTFLVLLLKGRWTSITSSPNFFPKKLGFFYHLKCWHG